MTANELSKEAADALDALDSSEDELRGEYVNPDAVATAAALDALDSDSDEKEQQVPNSHSTDGAKGENTLDQNSVAEALDALDSSDDNDTPSLSHRPPNFDLNTRSASPNRQIHHELVEEALNAFEYPVDMEVRDYQRNIVRKALTQNLICALPTGLGKTFIATVVMLNWFKWTKTAKILFVAPTRPLVAQQVQSFLQMSGISIYKTAALLQSVVDRKRRAVEWSTKRVFFATAQTVENDIKQGIVDPRDFVLLVMDEAHRATGNHSYVNVIKMVRSVNQDFRVLALTATPSGKFDGVQQIIDTLGISATEIRSEESLDIRKYVHARQVERVVVEPSNVQLDLMRLAVQATQEQMQVLQRAGIAHQDISNTHPFMLQQEAKRYMGSSAARFNPARKFQIQAISGLMSKMAYATLMLRNHGVMPFYVRMHELELELMGSKGVNTRRLLNAPGFRELMNMSRTLIYGSDKGPTYKYAEEERDPAFVGHPKLEYLVDIINNFQRDRSADSRIIIFAEFRDSAAEILWILGRHSPQIVHASLFVGQTSASKATRVKGMSQKEQQAVLAKFKAGEINVLVATSIGEEGLDIGQVDLIVCYDQSQSPIRNIQRMGRTGRKRDGSVYMLMTPKEESKLSHAFGGHKYIRDRIYQSSGTTELNVGDALRLRYAPPTRLIPLEFEPKYREVAIETPAENEAALASGDVIAAMKELSKVSSSQRHFSVKRNKSSSEAPRKRAVMDDGDNGDETADTSGFRSAAEVFHLR